MYTATPIVPGYEPRFSMHKVPATHAITEGHSEQSKNNNCGRHAENTARARGDWVVMAAWLLVQLCTRLLLPADAPAGHEATAEAERLDTRLVALRQAAVRLIVTSMKIVYSSAVLADLNLRCG
jgi:hypothetical protein